MTVPNARIEATEFFYYISPDGVSHLLHDPPNRAVMSFTGFGKPPSNLNRTKGPYQHGETPSSIRLNPRTISLVIRHNECDRSNYWSARSTLLNTLGLNRTDVNYPQPGYLKFVRYASGAKIQRQVKVFLSDGLLYEPRVLGQWDEYAIQETLNFEALDPVLYDPVQKEVSITSFTDSLILPMTFPFILGSSYATQDITYNGSWFSYPTLEITGPAVDFNIINQSIDKTIRLDYNINTGETVTINLDYDIKTVENNLGVNLVSKVTKNSDLDNFVLMHDPLVTDGTNSFYISLNGATGDTEVKIKYYERYYGI